LSSATRSLSGDAPASRDTRRLGICHGRSRSRFMRVIEAAYHTFFISQARARTGSASRFHSPAHLGVAHGMAKGCVCVRLRISKPLSCAGFPLRLSWLASRWVGGLGQHLPSGRHNKTITALLQVRTKTCIFTTRACAAAYRCARREFSILPRPLRWCEKRG